MDDHYSTASAATGCLTQQSDLENHNWVWHPVATLAVL